MTTTTDCNSSATVPVSAAMLAEEIRRRRLTVLDCADVPVDPDYIAAELIEGFADDARKAAGEPEPLPAWDEMTDLDKGAALLHLHARESEGSGYAIENYAARYFDHPALTGLSPADACEHAASMQAHADALPFDVTERLYDAALEARNRN